MYNSMWLRLVYISPGSLSSEADFDEPHLCRNKTRMYSHDASNIFSQNLDQKQCVHCTANSATDGSSLIPAARAKWVSNLNGPVMLHVSPPKQSHLFPNPNCVPIYIQLGTLGCIPTSLWRCLALHFNCGGSLDTQGLAYCWWVTLGEMAPAILARSEDSWSQMQSFLWQLGLTHQ